MLIVCPFQRPTAVCNGGTIAWQELCLQINKHWYTKQISFTIFNKNNSGLFFLSQFSINNMALQAAAG
jgi:hypothetical protein